MKMNIENLGLTEKDFDLLQDALEVFPDHKQTGGMMAELMGSILAKGEKQEQSIQREIAKMKRKREDERKAMLEDVRILQAKIFNLKRFLREKGFLEEVDEILKKSE